MSAHHSFFELLSALDRRHQARIMQRVHGPIPQALHCLLKSVLNHLLLLLLDCAPKHLVLPRQALLDHLVEVVMNQGLRRLRLVDCLVHREEPIFDQHSFVDRFIFFNLLEFTDYFLLLQMSQNALFGSFLLFSVFARGVLQRLRHASGIKLGNIKGALGGEQHFLFNVPFGRSLRTSIKCKSSCPAGRNSSGCMVILLFEPPYGFFFIGRFGLSIEPLQLLEGVPEEDALRSVNFEHVAPLCVLSHEIGEHLLLLLGVVCLVLAYKYLGHFLLLSVVGFVRNSLFEHSVLDQILLEGGELGDQLEESVMLYLQYQCVVQYRDYTVASGLAVREHLLLAHVGPLACPTDFQNHLLLKGLFVFTGHVLLGHCKQAFLPHFHLALQHKEQPRSELAFVVEQILVMKLQHQGRAHHRQHFGVHLLGQLLPAPVQNCADNRILLPQLEIPQMLIEFGLVYDQQIAILHCNGSLVSDAVPDHLAQSELLILVQSVEVLVPEHLLIVIKRSHELISSVLGNFELVPQVGCLVLLRQQPTREPVHLLPGVLPSQQLDAPPQEDVPVLCHLVTGVEYCAFLYMCQFEVRKDFLGTGPTLAVAKPR